MQFGSPSLSSANTKIAITINVTWKHKCRYATFTPATILDMNNQVDEANVSQTIAAFAHSESPTDCGQQALTVSTCTPVTVASCTVANFFSISGF
jgi:hypothetical protein